MQDGDPGWAALPPLRPTWATQTPLTTHPLPPAPPPLTTQARPLRPATPSDGAPEPGRVVGLAAVVRPKAVPEPPAPLPSYFREQPPLRHVTARPISDHPRLTEATDDYVGEPLSPAPPPAAPASPVFTQYPSRPDPEVQATTDAGARFREALANLHNSGLPRYVSPSDSPSQASQVSQAEAAPPPPSLPTPDDQPRLTHRRNTLAQSRRLGLGAPIRREGDETSDDGGGDASPDAEPDAAAPPAPVTAPAPVIAAVPTTPSRAPDPPHDPPSTGVA
ncbi:MAG TPA: hypothetical protein VKB75_13205, partial [Jatrophihabitans sp.]|nr:hypothetical protein [Jatrophihabitans sp.]